MFIMNIVIKYELLIAKQKMDVRGVIVRADAEVTSEVMVEFERFYRAGVVIRTANAST